MELDLARRRMTAKQMISTLRARREPIGCSTSTRRLTDGLGSHVVEPARDSVILCSAQKSVHTKKTMTQLSPARDGTVTRLIAKRITIPRLGRMAGFRHD